ncbi:hypothetical protein D3C79_952510 [compost metagenome]
MQQVEHGRQARAIAAQAATQGGHGRQAGVAADDRDGSEQQYTDAGADDDRQHRIGQAQAGAEQGAGLQHHQANAEGKPQGTEVAAAEHALRGGDRMIGGKLAGCAHESGLDRR